MQALRKKWPNLRPWGWRGWRKCLFNSSGYELNGYSKLLLVDNMPQKIKFQSKGIVIAGILFAPPGDSGKGKRAAIVVAHPFGGVKEQTAGLYANWYITRSLDALATYSSYAFVDLISPHPLLMIAGTEADTLYFSREAIAAAKEPKELFLVDGKTHIDLYDDTTKSLPKLVGFMTKYLLA